MKILAIDSSGLSASIAILQDDKIIAEYTINYKMTHSQTLLPMLDEVSKMIDLDINTIDIIAVTNGPGSFTGLRISAGTAKAMALGLDIAIVEIPTLDAIASNVMYTDNYICPIMDARRDRVYTSMYKWEEEGLKKLKEDSILTIDELKDRILKNDKKTILLGDGVKVYKEKLEEAVKDKIYITPPSQRLQRASTIAVMAKEKALNKETVSHMEYAPKYLRQTQAEREYKQNHKE